MPSLRWVIGICVADCHNRPYKISLCFAYKYLNFRVIQFRIPHSELTLQPRLILYREFSRKTLNWGWVGRGAATFSLLLLTAQKTRFSKAARRSSWKTHQTTATNIKTSKSVLKSITKVIILTSRTNVRKLIITGCYPFVKSFLKKILHFSSLAFSAGLFIASVCDIIVKNWK